jgi:sugar PTS system EIIA component
MFNIFKSKNKPVEIKFSVKGKSLNIADVPDEVFATKMVGDGIAFEPKEGIIYSPVDGEILQTFRTKHAVGIKSKEGIEILIHIGIDTVHMNGEGFEYLIKENQMIKAGEKIMTFDIDLINKKAKSNLIPMLITNMEIVEDIQYRYLDGDMNDVAMTVKLK